jgi:hypothetical protein
MPTGCESANRKQREAATFVLPGGECNAMPDQTMRWQIVLDQRDKEKKSSTAGENLDGMRISGGFFFASGGLRALTLYGLWMNESMPVVLWYNVIPLESGSSLLFPLHLRYSIVVLVALMMLFHRLSLLKGLRLLTPLDGSIALRSPLQTKSVEYPEFCRPSVEYISF